jgi:hypothetical protein
VPTTYTGDQTQTQLPSDPPEGEGFIQASLPADGDDPNAATFEQAFKVCADFIDWLMKPKATASEWEKVILPFRAAIGHRRFAVDHMGFPTGQVLVHDVNWRAAVAGATQYFNANPGAVYGSMPDWTYTSVNAGAGTSRAIMGPSYYGPALGVLPGEVLNDYITVSMAPLGSLRADNHVVLEFSSVVPIQTTLTTHIAICDSPGTHVAAEANFIGFRINGAGNWFCVTKAAGVTTATDSGVTAAIGAPVTRGDRLRIEWSGETVADDATRCCRFYINGAKVAEHFTNLPLGMLTGISISEVRTTAGAGGDTLIVGPMRLRMSLSQVDTVL